MAMRTGAPRELDRRSLYADLAERLDEELRRIHIGWCLNQARVSTPASTPEVAPAEPNSTTGHSVTGFIEDALGGLERAVLQLELGAGRDSSTARAALRLAPRQYARHRELGLGKLRGAISGSLSGKVCGQHLEAVTLAATGDRDAAEGLASGPARCRACAREAAGLRRVLQQRLALAPWPFVIKPAGVIAAKLGAIGALLGGKGAAGSGAGFAGAGSAGGAKVVAAVIATAAVATGGIAAVEHENDPAAIKRTAAAAVSAPVKKAAATRPATSTAATSTTRSRTERRRAAADIRKKAATPTTSKPANSPVTTATGTGETSSTSTSTTTASRPKPADPVRKAVENVKNTVDKVTGKLPVKLPTVDEVAPGLTPTVDGVTGTVDDLLTP
jgi:hypothetical protein